MPRIVFEGLNLNFIIKMPNIGNNSTIFHGIHMFPANNIFIPRRGNKNIYPLGNIFYCNNLVAFHCGLQCTNRVNLRYHHTTSRLSKRRSRALTNTTKTANQCRFSGHHHICTASDPINQRFTTPINIIKF